MTRIFTEGAEFGDLLFWPITNWVQISAIGPRSGIYSYYFMEVNWPNNTNALKTIPALSELYFRMAVKVSDGSLSVMLYFRKGTTSLITVGWNSPTNCWFAQVGGVTKVTSSVPCFLNTWHLIEVHVKIDNSTGVLELKIDGLTAPTFNGDTQPGADTTIDNLYFYHGDNCGAYYLDDMALNDTAGGVDDSWCGDGHIILLRPNEDGDVVNALVGNDGNSVDNYLLVDEIPSDADTTYVEGSVIDEYDLYGLTASGLVDVDILRVWAESRAKETVAEGGQLVHVIKTGGSEFQDAVDRDLILAYLQFVGDQYLVNPDTTNPWEVAELDALMVGPKVR